jgi:hypothetical protein
LARSRLVGPSTAPMLITGNIPGQKQVMDGVGGWLILANAVSAMSVIGTLAYLRPELRGSKYPVDGLRCSARCVPLDKTGPRGRPRSSGNLR